MAKAVPSLWKASWMTCAVGSLAHGTTARRGEIRPEDEVGIGDPFDERFLLLRVFAGIVCVNMEAGSVIGLPPKNLSIGISLPRATPA
jgi:hypothetical protein